MQSRAFGQQVQIHQQGYQSPFEVVADLLIVAVGIAAVELDPSFCTALQQALDRPAWCGQQATDVLGQIAEVVRFTAETGMKHDQLVVIAGDTFGKPELRDQHSAAIAVRT